ncbi:hypothetical protein E2C01_096331 [Portunus trituberculatus]|uniref:Uncharacterized protein n=1 Tax=Portunus trituberculatus TaxID=210409 RepID=A0A5B7K1G4_PORTR|nr:hypothetical protein [Portunus trituberculatus]
MSREGRLRALRESAGPPTSGQAPCHRFHSHLGAAGGKEGGSSSEGEGERGAWRRRLRERRRPPDRYQCLKTAVPLCHHETSLEPSCLPRGAAPSPPPRPPLTSSCSFVKWCAIGRRWGGAPPRRVWPAGAAHQDAAMTVRHQTTKCWAVSEPSGGDTRVLILGTPGPHVYGGTLP